MSLRAPLIPVQVTEILSVTPLVKQFRLVRPDGRDLPRFSGGAHIVVAMQHEGRTHRNAYSLMSDPRETGTYRVSVRREAEGRGGSRYLHDHLREGMTLQISHPVNLFPLAKRAARHLFIAGGIGITPFLAMMAELEAGGPPFALHYAARSRTLAAYGAALVARYGTRVHLYHSDEGERLDLPGVLSHQPLGTHLYVCGPQRMIDAVLAEARACGWPETQLHREHFLSPPSGEAYRVELARSGKVVEVGPLESMLEALEAAGVDAPSLCRGGACGQCETRVVQCDGHLLHADNFLSAADKAAGAKVMPCVSRFTGQRLVLDL
ncbi:PDR/VanB family oxidoreductase [Acidisoma sp. 7E03]